jgi:hypothetical protein
MNERKNMEEETKVLFRNFQGEITAIFPEEPGTPDYYNTCSCYAHIGQHGSCDLSIISNSKHVKPEDYEDLKKELESEPYNYNLRVMKRHDWQKAFQVRRDKVKNI